MTNIYWNPHFNPDKEEACESFTWLFALETLRIPWKYRYPPLNSVESCIILGATAKGIGRLSADIIWPHLASYRICVSEVLKSSTFRNWAKRIYYLLPMDTQAIVRAAQHLPGDRVFIKDCLHSKRSFRFICGKLDECTIKDEIGYFAAQYEGDKDCVMVSEWVKMESECRFVVIDKKIVNCSIQIPELTPFDNWGLHAPRFKCVSTQMQRDADEIVADFAKELPELEDYVLDLCEVNGSTSIVEINPCMNFGLFACNTIQILVAILNKCGALDASSIDQLKGQPNGHASVVETIKNSIANLIDKK